jgi:UDP-glucose 4-epimerase
MRVLVTGGAGFIGSHLTDALLDRGDQVTVVDDLSTGRLGRLDDRAVVHKLTVTDATPLTELAQQVRPELICHLAAQIDIHASVAAPADDARANVAGTVNVLEAARATGARVLFCSTGGALYGKDAPIPSLEDVIPLPESPLGVAKFCAEQYVCLYNRLHGCTHTIVRLASVYGPRQDPAGESGVIPIFCARTLAGQPPVIYGDGTQTRDYVYIADAVAGLLAATDQFRPGIWNVGTGTETTVLGLTRLISDTAGRSVDPRFEPARPGELHRSALAAHRAARDLGWRPTVRLADGVQRVYRWLEAGAPDRAAA